MSRWMFERGGLLALACFGLYAWIAPAHTTTGDNAEFVGLGALGGAAHPTGYPLYVLWLRAWSWLPVDTPAHASALATAVLGALTVLAVHAACRAWGARPTAASFAVALVASTPIFVRLASEAEVFAMNTVVAGTILWLAAPAGPLQGLARAVALGVVAGLGLSNHLTCVFLAPVGLYGVGVGIREHTRGRLVAAGAALVAFVIGLAPYAYLLVVPETRASWGKVEGLGELVHHVLRMDYGGPGELAAVDRGGTPGDNLWALGGTLLRGYLWGPLAVGLVALVAGCVRGRQRVAWLALAASFLLAGPALIARFNLRPEGIHEFITHRFHMLPLVVLAVPVAAGLSWLGEGVVARSTLLRSPPVLGSLAVVVALALQAVTLPDLAGQRSPATERSVENTLRSLPPNAVLIATPDEIHFGAGYLQGALGIRPDVVVITWQLVGLPYMRERVRRQLGFTIEELPPGSTDKLSVVVAEKILALGRPLFIDVFQGNIATSLPLYPYGLVYRVLPRGTPLPPITEVFAINKQLYEQYRIDYELPRRAHVIPAQQHVHYAKTWQVLGDGLAAAGHAREADYARRMAYALAPEQ